LNFLDFPNKTQTNNTRKLTSAMIRDHNSTQFNATLLNIA